MQKKPHILYLLLGSNLGDRKKHLSTALDLIRELIGPVIRVSSIYETEPWGFSSENYFFNMVVQVGTFVLPREVMLKIGEIEETFGRKRQGRSYSSRTMDVDILFYDDLVMKGEELQIPHPLIQERRFVLVPLNEIATDLIHPVFQKSIGELFNNCPDTKKVRKLVTR